MKNKNKNRVCPVSLLWNKHCKVTQSRKGHVLLYYCNAINNVNL